MQLSDRTLNILKNYAGINLNIVFESGNQLKTISVARNVLSAATITEDIPKTFGIYSLSEFLGVLNLVDNPSLTFEDEYVLISDSNGRSSIKYFYSEPETLTSPTKMINMPDAEVKFTLDTATLSRLKRAASTLNHDEISIKPSNGSIELSVMDAKNNTSNVFSVLVEGEYEEGADFNFIINNSNINLINEDFEVSISSKLISNFKSKQSEIEYFIAVEKSSKYGA